MRSEAAAVHTEQSCTPVPWAWGPSEGSSKMQRGAEGGEDPSPHTAEFPREAAAARDASKKSDSWSSQPPNTQRNGEGG